MKKTFFLSFAAVLFLSACMKLEPFDLPDPAKGSVPSFSPSLEAFTELKPYTKAAEPASMNGFPGKLFLHSFTGDFEGFSDPFPTDTKSAPVSDVHSTIVVSGYSFAGAWSESNEPNLFYKTSLSQITGSMWEASDGFWPGQDYNVRYFAVSPGTAEGLSWVSSATSAGSPVISYTSPTDVSAQVDILESVSDADTDVAGVQDYPGNTSGPIPLRFKHALTAVQFLASDFGMNVKIKGIRLEGVYSSGRHVVGSAAWSSQATPATYSITFDKNVTDAGDVQLNEGATTFLMIPQTLPAGAKAVLVLHANSHDYEVECPLSGTWVPGSMVTYVVSIDENDWIYNGISVTNPSLIPGNTNDNTAVNIGTVLSFRLHASGIRSAMAWSAVDYSLDGGTTWGAEKPDWLASFTDSGEGGWNGETVSAALVDSRYSERSVLVKLRMDADDTKDALLLVSTDDQVGLTFEIIEGGNLYWKAGSSSSSYFKTIEYSLDGGLTWNSVTSSYAGNGSLIANLSAGDKITFRGNLFLSGGSSYYLQGLTSSGTSFVGDSDLVFYAYGNPECLYSGTIDDNPSGYYAFRKLFSNCSGLRNHPNKDIILPSKRCSKYCYSQMFYGCTGLTSAPELPATSLANYCYQSMFSGCTGLTSAPELPATTLASNCYYQMFQGCTGLTVSPELPAISLVDNCYNSMFYGCTGLTTAPELPATTLADVCYDSMFKGCTGLTVAPELPATSLSSSCYSSMFSGCTGLTSAPELPVTSLATSCYGYMFSGCTGLTSAPELPAITLADYCYQQMFKDCTGLTTAPELPATTLASCCYRQMYYGCTGLTSAPELPAITLADYCYQEMFRGCKGLTSAPELPATTLAQSCYYEMFYGCTGLTFAPDILPATTLAQHCYREMFYGCTGLTSAPELPATLLAEYCYRNMFSNCTSLTFAPELPATTLASSCYYSMFGGCTGLTAAPELPATTLASSCYYSMFQGCTGLTSVPELPASTLAVSCYRSMFYGCTGLTNAPELPATTLAQSCYQQMFYDCTGLTSAPELPATTLVESCYYAMFYGCRGLTAAPELPATTLASFCYYAMFGGCLGLTAAPELSATTLAQSCYSQMFSGCFYLSYVKCLATDISASNCLSYWLNNVPSTGTFVKKAGVTYPSGTSGIPSGWTVEEI